MSPFRYGCVIMVSILIAYTYGCQTQTSYSGVKTRLNLVSGKKWPWNKFSMPKRFVSYLAVFHNHLTSHNCHDRPAPQLPTIVYGIIRVRLQQVRSNSLFKIQVNYRQVCIRAWLDRPFLWVNAKYPCGVVACDFGDPLYADSILIHASAQENRQHCSNARKAGKS